MFQRRDRMKAVFMPEIAAIVPAYNEEKTIAEVVQTLKRAACFTQIIVISDGSTDRTSEAARTAGATEVHELSERAGKGNAMLHGLRHTAAPIVFFADADLKGFRPEHVLVLVEPVRRGELAMAVGLRDRGPLLLKIEAVLPLIAGERALRREVIESVAPEHLRGFKVEAAMNYRCRAAHWPYRGIPLHGLGIRTKVEKVGWFRAVPQYIKMYWQVASAIVSVRLARLLGKFVLPAAESREL